ncbi:MAG: hypothetical protein HY883_03510 [Deltaproteobacteria bacterium]|nr:hypothetical protein [Deltaproteobacteria bacterium]
MNFFSKGIYWPLVAVFLAVLAGGGCSALRQGGALPAEPKGGAFKKIAVLPFNNISGRKDAGSIVTNTYLTELFKSNRFRVEEPGNILQFMMQERIGTIGEMEIERIRILGKRLKVDGVVAGTVEEFDDGRGGPPVVSVVARLIDSESGRIVWSGQNKKRGDDYIIIFDFGEIRSATALAQRVVREMISTIEW